MAVRKPTEWKVEEARRHLRALVGEAKQAGPLPVERQENQEALVVPVPQWGDRPHPLEGSLLEFFKRSGMQDSEADLERDPMTADDLDEWMRNRGTFDDLERLADALMKERGDGH